MSLKSKLVLLITLSTLPLFFVVLVFTYRQFQDAQSSKLTELQTIANLTASEHKQITEGARQLLIALSATPAVLSDSSTECSGFLASLRARYVRYVNFGVIDKARNVLCAADLAQAKENPPYQGLIDQTLASHTFTIGTYYQTADGNDVINYAYPLTNDSVVYVSLSLDWVSDFIALLPSPSELVINILDQDGTVLARRPRLPDAQGHNFASDPVVQQILQKGNGTSIRTGLDQITRLYAFVSLGEDRKTYIAVGLPQQTIFGDVRITLISSVITILFIASISVILALRIGDVLLVKQIEAQQSLDQLKDDFISLASHQIRSPMTAIRWLTESLMDTNLTKAQRSSLQKVHSTTLRLISLTSMLLNISRLESGTITFKRKRLSLQESLKPVLSEMTPVAHREKRKMTVHITNSTFETDHILLGEIIRVLLVNAIRYSYPHTTITLSCSVSKSRLILRVSNTGVGITKDASKHLFTRFYRTDTARDISPDGNGLGLHLARLISRKLGGDLTFQSKPEGTTVFTLFLPNTVL